MSRVNHRGFDRVCANKDIILEFKIDGLGIHGGFDQIRRELGRIKSRNNNTRFNGQIRNDLTDAGLIQGQIINGAENQAITAILVNRFTNRATSVQKLSDPLDVFY